MSNFAVELLSPAGDYKAFTYALAYGADAVYLGAKQFGMRSSSGNFTPEELAKTADEAHVQGKRVYLTLNTLPTNLEIAQMPAAINEARLAGIDAFIVADLGVLDLVQKHAPGAEIHLSTQAGIVNYAAAAKAHELGAKRVVLARELGVEDIAFIRRNTPPGLELEVFVHGAMCMSVSGRCLLSNYLTGRDANRGECPQSCRWRYTLHEETRPGQAFEIGEGEGGSYILSADDLCMAPYLDILLTAGVNSLKIEGRAKSFYYAASVTAAYRASLNAALAAAQAGEEYFCPDFALEELRKTSHRPYSTGFFLGRQRATQSPARGDYIREWQIIAETEDVKNGRLPCIQRGKFTLGETLELLLPGGRTVCFTPADIWGENGECISSTPHPQMQFSIPAPAGVEKAKYGMLRKQIVK